MNEETLTALKKSIEKWERNAVVEDLKEAQIFGDSCALCELFADEDDEEGVSCFGCPVREKTGK